MKSNIPIIALTADVTTVDLAKCKAVGMNDYIAKPVDERLLYRKIVSLIKKPLMIKSNDMKENESEHPNKQKYTDLNYLMQRTKNNPELMMEMISLYLEQTPPLISTMKSSLEKRDWESLHAAVHKMIPSFAIVGISPDYEEIAKKIKEFASTQQQEEEITDLVLQIEKVCAQACIELKEDFNSYKKTH
jgi:CheY-like chemotaxis protein